MPAPVPVQTVTAGSTLSTTVSQSITVGSGSDRGLIIGVSQKAGTWTDTVTVGGASATLVLRGSPGGSPRASLWHFVAPSTGSLSCVATATGSPSSMDIFITEVTGLDQTTPLDASGTHDQYIATITKSITSGGADKLMIIVAAISGGAITWGSGQTDLVKVTGKGGMSYKNVGSGSQSMSETSDYNWQDIVVATFSAAAGGGGVSVPVLIANSRMRGGFINV